MCVCIFVYLFRRFLLSHYLSLFFIFFHLPFLDFQRQQQHVSGKNDFLFVILVHRCVCLFPSSVVLSFYLVFCIFFSVFLIKNIHIYILSTFCLFFLCFCFKFESFTLFPLSDYAPWSPQSPP